MLSRQYGVRFRTHRPAEQLEDWLAIHCTADWKLRLSGIVEDDQGNRCKQLIVFFDDEKDRDEFKACFFRH